MSEMNNDGTGGGQGGEQQQGDGGGGAVTEQSDGGQQQNTAPDWLGSLPEDLRGDATLARYKDPEALARSHVELRKVAGSRVIVPGADADDATRSEFFEAIGRPKEPTGYEFDVPEGFSPDLSNTFRDFAFKTGMPKEMAEATVKFNNEQVLAQQQAHLEAGQAEVDAIAAETPEYKTKIEAAKTLFKKFGGTPEIADALDVKLGSGNLIKFFLGMAASVGEHGRIDGEDTNPGGRSVDPGAELDALQKDAGWRERFNNGDVEAVAQRDRLLTAARSAANTKKRPA